MTCLPTAVQGILWEFAGPWTLRNLMHEAFTSEVDWFEEIEPLLLGNDHETLYVGLTLRNKSEIAWNFDLQMEHDDWTVRMELSFSSLEKMMDFEPRFRTLAPPAVDFPTPMLALPDEEWEHLVGMEDMADHRDWVTLSSRAEFLQRLREMQEAPRT